MSEQVGHLPRQVAKKLAPYMVSIITDGLLLSYILSDSSARMTAA